MLLRLVRITWMLQKVFRGGMFTCCWRSVHLYILIFQDNGHLLKEPSMAYEMVRIKLFITTIVSP